MKKNYDVILIGGGHNGLTAAAYLAKAGQRVLVLERRAVVGGAAVTEEIYPGFKFDTCAHAGGLWPEIVRDLDLGRHGLEMLNRTGGQLPAPTFTPLPDGNHLLLWEDGGKTVEAIRRFSKADADKWVSFSTQMGRLARFLKAVQSVTLPAITTTSPAELLTLLGLGGRLRRLGGRDMAEALRLLPMPVAELLNDWFETDALKGTLGAGGVTGIFQGPRASGTAYVLLHQLAGANGVFRAAATALGGVGGIAGALAAAAQAHGAEIRTGAEVAQVIVKDGRATGVALRSGEEFGARRIASNADPARTFLGLVAPLELEPEFVRAVRNIKFRGACAKVNLALGMLPKFTALPADGAAAHLRGAISISPSLDYLEHAYDDAKYGNYSQKPYLEIVIPSLADPSLAPAGKHVMSILVQYAPYRLKEGTWNDKREALGDAVVETLAAYAPDIKSAILHRQVLTPMDLEATYGLTEGNMYHGELTLDQLFFMRPVPGWAKYRTPIEGLYLCGAGAHPGGGVTGAPGRNAAREILKDVKRRI